MNILSIQGGGTRGIMQAVILDKLGYKTDFVAGTSVGSMIAACVALGVPMSTVIQFFFQQAPKIFSGAWWIPLPRLWSSAKYSPDNLRLALTSMLGTATLADCRCKFIATGFEMKTGRITYFQSYGASSSDGDEIVIGPDSKMPLVDVCMASSAAQSYFPGHAWGGYLFWDGGNTGFNCPDMLALSEARQTEQQCNVRMLSLGNGRTPWPYSGEDMTDPSIATVAGVTFDIAYAGPENSAVWLARSVLGDDAYTRIDPVIPNFDIDDASEATLTSMQSAALAAISKNP